MPRPPRPLAPASAQRLLLAAADAFGAKGLDDASLNDILKRAGMGKGSFYHRFADKAALHDWVTETMAGRARTALAAPGLGTLSAASFRQELTAMLARFMVLAGEHPELANLGLMFHNSADAPPERTIARVRATVLGWIEAALTRGRELRVIRDDLPSDLLTQWTVASLTTIDRWVLADPDGPSARGAVAATAVDALWALLAL
ncbi:TetR/AcrR family transcriptional regulator [Humibacter ginsenosidimutans]|nr:TetR/AcrR family transcriptional regulator [Humibacter ginsenosidimutans]